VNTWANRVTLARVILIPVFVVVLLARLPNYGPWIAALIFTALAATDAVDGYLARSRNEVTTFGKFIDPLADKLLVTAALVSLVELDKISAWIAIIIISREFIVTGLRLVSVAEGKVIAASRYGRLKTIFQIAAIVGFIVKDSPLIAQVIGSIGEMALQALAWGVMGVAIGLTLLSMFDYFYHARDILSGPWGGASS
jgi:CDP-diacylglycerol--glycerol-3-phosphate 3-phosphatidyltransferase